MRVFTTALPAISLSLFIVVSLSVSTTSHALQRGDSVTYPQTQAEHLISTMDDTLWAADGAAGDKHVYVIYSPSCGWSKKLYHDARKASGDVQIRWIPRSGLGADWVATERTASAVQKAFAGNAERPSNPDKAAAALKYNRNAVRSVSEFVATNGGRSYTYPTLIYQSAKGVEVHVGTPENFTAIAANIVARPEKSSHKPAGEEIIATDVEVTKVSGLERYSNKSDTKADVLSFPSRKGFILTDLSPGYGLTALGVTDNGYVVVKPYRDNTRGYIYNPDFVELSRLEYDIVPKQGSFAANNQAYTIMSHPSAKADVLTTLKKGYAIKQIGITVVSGEEWDVVKPYADNTKGFVKK